MRMSLESFNTNVEYLKAVKFCGTKLLFKLNEISKGEKHQSTRHRNINKDGSESSLFTLQEFLLIKTPGSEYTW